MYFDYIGGSDVRVEWEADDAEATTSFFKVFFPNNQIIGNSISINFGDFFLNTSNFHQLDKSLKNKSAFSDSLKRHLTSFPRYEAEINKNIEIDDEEIKSTLKNRGFKRDLFWYQLRNVKNMVMLKASANFSVPGAGKTTDALATYLYRRKSDNDKVLILCPYSAFGAWEEDLENCLTGERLIHLGGLNATKFGLETSANFKILNYEKFRDDEVVRNLIKSDLFNPEKNYTVILDESHRISGEKISKAIKEITTVPQKIILSGTPMPHSAEKNLPAQFNFLYPQDTGVYSDAQDIAAKFQPIYKRTTKTELELKEPKINFIKCEMKGAQRILNERMQDPIRNHDLDLKDRENIRRFKEIVMRYLQFCSNPQLQYNYLNSLYPELCSELLDIGIGPKFEKIISDAETIVNEGEKIIIWSTFPKNLEILRHKLAFYNPVIVHGGIDVGQNDEDFGTRRYAIKEFKKNPKCMIFLANPSTAGEGISLHKVCSKALYLDRSYNAAHYLQSKDRIHRLGMPFDASVEINIYSYANSIDEAVEYNLKDKTQRMSEFLDDPSLTQNNVSLDLNFDKSFQEELTSDNIVSDDDALSVDEFFKK